MTAKKATTAKTTKAESQSGTQEESQDNKQGPFSGELTYPARVGNKTYPKGHKFDDLTEDQYNELKALKCLKLEETQTEDSEDE